MIESAFFGTEASFHHVGLAVKSIRAACPSSEVLIERNQRVLFSFIRLSGITIELLEPFGDDSPIAKSLEDGVKLLHLCYEVPDLESALKQCRAAGFHRVSRPVAAPAFDNRRIVWVYSKQYGLFELLERDGSPAARRGSGRANGG